eukprot:CAMPEP_0178401700 /NCGR_PEP_ID=MMETSP0689_2-20121128/16439_1 /TAXON_ID=160604 /ORGANISM="Amphidinium massartii, Strain CS-259" /LENGTH=738 /DNA_ID=CAMNT_0020022533 /DNA_START=36 /DNA_END=2249 /DNA_ORIENTATION=-
MVFCRASSKGPSATVTCQNDALTALITKHLGNSESLQAFQTGGDFTITSTERDLQRWEHAHLVAALDVLNSYQRDRKARTSVGIAGKFAPWSRQYSKDPRTRLIELLKRWLRTHAIAANIGEAEVRSVASLCRDLLNYPQIFPARNPRSFLQTIAEVYDHMQLQLREVLEKDRTCAELAQRAISLSKNLIADALSYLLLAATDLSATDCLPSLEVVALWQSLPAFEHPLPGRVDAKLQKQMREAWRTRCGIMIASVLRSPQVVRLFDGVVGEEEMAAERAYALTDQARSPVQQGGGQTPRTPRLMTPRTPQNQYNPEEELPRSVPDLVAFIEAEFDRGQYKGSGLAGYLRHQHNGEARRRYLDIILVYDLTYLLGEVFVQFHRISDGLGDYGTIRVAPWLHPFLEALTDKVLQLKVALEQLSQYIDNVLVLARARKSAVEKPCPSARMSSRAHAAVQRAAIGRDSHAPLLLATFEELKARSAPERLPLVVEGIGDACTQLQRALNSPEFRARIGDSFPELPPIVPGLEAEGVTGAQVLAEAIENNAQAGRVLALEDVDEPSGARAREVYAYTATRSPSTSFQSRSSVETASTAASESHHLPARLPPAPAADALATTGASPRLLGSRRLAAFCTEDASPRFSRMLGRLGRSPSPAPRRASPAPRQASPAPRQAAPAGTASARSHSQPGGAPPRDAAAVASYGAQRIQPRSASFQTVSQGNSQRRSSSRPRAYSENAEAE